MHAPAPAKLSSSKKKKAGGLGGAAPPAETVMPTNDFARAQARAGPLVVRLSPGGFLGLAEGGDARPSPWEAFVR